jgi:ADP-ribose pyrophosphatase
MTLFAAHRPADGRFTVLATENHFRGRIFSVRVDTLRMPGGGSARREIVDHMRAVAVVAIDDVGRVVLVEQYRHPLRRRLWEIPAGLMDLDGESPLACAQRELREEVGLAAENWSVLVDLASSPGYSTEAVRVYLATGLTAVERPAAEDEEADMRVVRVALGDAVGAAFDGRIVDASTVAGLLAAAQAGQTPAGSGESLRPGDDPWADSAALVNDGVAIGDASDLGGTVDLAGTVDLSGAAESAPWGGAARDALGGAGAANSVIPETAPDR